MIYDDEPITGVRVPDKLEFLRKMVCNAADRDRGFEGASGPNKEGRGHTDPFLSDPNVKQRTTQTIYGSRILLIRSSRRGSPRRFANLGSFLMRKAKRSRS